MAPRTNIDGDHKPDYPPKTPPPPKRPISPPRPEHQAPPGAPLMTTAQRGVALKNRRAANWVHENAPWSPAKAGRQVVTQLHAWGHRPDEPALEAVVGELVGAVLHDGGRRISVHLSDQDGQACVLVLSHQPNLTAGHAPDGDDVLAELSAHSIVSSCGTDTGEDGRRLWAVLDL
ncbi:hypothetical protein AR457_02040 [Streptomyces agglomeratus]|uniref:Histidine kinase/HSP90-like ATPase domain-containing protein n=1 Tax=Streptomyces agglomeratus TaxID=285458 RepID=A0A1E5P1U2_9ACTN|nr:hypothetical protein [Streptomyces agglomeratus]OEJ23467.1 hypothetical protein AS594_02150 [Streptomyces agglomeratus]OEJ43059.1 hypothetical protein AR457_02040 [Streptomyces agglomeratus]OEJ55025.1 hypothetical protein BGK72_33745 [Streptomyces agglomeratus]OEJ62391.1 hypothetical protein BGM19_34660 [Streptomyces agglomeratus]